MLWYEVFLFVCIVWNFIGFLVWCVVLPLGEDDCIQDMINPVKFYHTFNVNWFGAIICSFFMNLLSPIVSICSWICSWTYFICTVGRKE